MKIRLTVEFEVEEGNKYGAAADIEAAAKGIKIDKAEQTGAKVSFPTGPKAKKSK